MLNLVFEVAVYAYAVGGDDEGIGVGALYYALQLLHFVAVDAYAQHRGSLVGVGTFALPLGNAAAHHVHYFLRDVVIRLLGEDEGLNIDVLLMHTVQNEAPSLMPFFWACWRL